MPVRCFAFYIFAVVIPLKIKISTGGFGVITWKVTWNSATLPQDFENYVSSPY